MAKQQLYIVHGMGSDAVGLVGRITAPIAAAGGNIVDLRQDVLHGLFTIYLVIDLSNGQLELTSLQTILAAISEDTELSLTVNQYTPVARVSGEKDLLMILIGRDQPGIIASSSKMLGQYNANIEFVQTIGREGIFLMELLTDVSHTTIPVDNLKRTVRENMQELDIAAIFQEEQVFNKRKRVILFHIHSSFLDEAMINEIIAQTGIEKKELQAAFNSNHALSLATAAADRLEGLPIDVIEAVLSAVSPTAGSLELIQTLKVMGYKIALASTGLSFFTERLHHCLDLDYAFGFGLEVDHDQRTVTGNLLPEERGADDINTVLTHLTTFEKVAAQDITIIADKEEERTPGIRVKLNLDVLLECFNQCTLSRENMIGLLGSFGQLRFD